MDVQSFAVDAPLVVTIATLGWCWYTKIMLAADNMNTWANFVI